MVAAIGHTPLIKLRRASEITGCNILAKAEWVNQKYSDFPLTDIRNGGQFKGFMVQGVIGF